MKKLYALVLAVSLTLACASLPAKQKAVNGVQLAEVTLGQAQDIERQLCNPQLAVQTPPVPITTCTGPTAATIGLDDAKHKVFVQALSNAFGLQIKATTALEAWLLFDERMGPLSVVGVAVTAVGVALAVRTQRADARPLRGPRRSPART